MRRYLLGIVFLLILAGTSGQSAPQVTPTGFLVKLETNIHAPVAKVYEALVAQIGLWWNPEHTYSHDAKNLSIDPRPGGCFCEKLPNGGGIEHLRVVYIAPPQIVRFCDWAIAKNKSRIGDRHHVISPTVGKLLDSEDHAFRNQRRSGVKVARLVLTAGENFHVSATHIDNQHIHSKLLSAIVGQLSSCAPIHRRCCDWLLSSKRPVETGAG